MTRLKTLARLALAVLTLAPSAHAAHESAAAALHSSFQRLMQTPILELVPGTRKLETGAGREEELIRFLDDRDAAVRAEAAKALKAYAQTSQRTETALLSVLERRNELAAVKREAVKSLAFAAQRHAARQALLGLARQRRGDIDLRVIALKALYVVSHEHEARNLLQKTLDDRHEDAAVRGAAAWALAGDATRDYATKRALLTAAQDRFRPASLRLEAIKSLFGAVQSDYEVRNLVEAVAKNVREDAALRVGATLSLIAVNGDHSVQRLLEALSRSDAVVAVRTAAIKALQNGLDLELARYFHLSHYQGRFIDPLEDQ